MYRNNARFLSLFTPNDGPDTPATDGPGSGGGGGQQQQAPQGGPQTPQVDPDKGFPENTPIAQMTDAEKANYYKFQNRQTDNKLAAFKGVTPEQVQQMLQENEQLKTAQLSATDKALKEAADKAAADAKAAAEADWRPKYQASQLKSAASQVIKGEQLDSFLAITDPSKFADQNGEIDEEKVIGHLTALFGGGQQQQQSRQQPNYGQYSGGSGQFTRPGDAGKAAAEKRFGKPT